MMVSMIYKSCFFVYWGVGDFHLEILMYGEKFCQDMRANLCKFFRLYMAPELVIRKKRKHEWMLYD